MVYKGEDIFIRFDRMYERDRRTERQTDGHRMTAQATHTATVTIEGEQETAPKLSNVTNFNDLE